MSVNLIVDAVHQRNALPSPPCGVVLPLAAGADSLLQWDRERQKAKELVSQGYRLLWELQLGLFDALSLPIGDQMQFQSLQLAFRYFVSTLWQEWSQESLGVIVWRGEGGVWPSRLWNDEEEVSFSDWGKETGRERSDYIFQRQWEYVQQLTQGGEENLPLYVALSLQVPVEKELSWLHPGRIAPFVLALTPQKLPWEGLHWDRENAIFMVSPHSPSTIGICLPPLGVSCDAQYLQVLENLQKHGRSFRLLSEESLLQNLEGLDQILYSSRYMTQEGLRKLQGFAAAGGELLDFFSIEK